MMFLGQIEKRKLQGVEQVALEEAGKRRRAVKGALGTIFGQMRLCNLRCGRKEEDILLFAFKHGELVASEEQFPVFMDRRDVSQLLYPLMGICCGLAGEGIQLRGKGLGRTIEHTGQTSDADAFILINFRKRFIREETGRGDENALGRKL